MFTEAMGMMPGSRDDWETPDWLFRELDDEFHFTLDAAASDTNHKCGRYFTKEDNALNRNWGGVRSSAIHRMVGR